MEIADVVGEFIATRVAADRAFAAAHHQRIRGHKKEGNVTHRGVDANYNVGPNGQAGINLQHPAVRAPVDGIVTNAGEGTAGRIAIRDANGLSHEILHTHTRHVRTGDPVVAGQLIGTMGNMGVDRKGIEKAIRRAAGSFVGETTRRRPMIVPTVIPV